MRTKRLQAPSFRWAPLVIALLLALQPLLAGPADAQDGDAGLDVERVVLHESDLHGFVLDRDAPLRSGLGALSGRMFQDFQDQLEYEGWQRAFISFDGQRGVSIEVSAFASATAARTLVSSRGQPGEIPGPLPPRSVSTVLDDGPGFFSVGALFTIGSTAVRVEAFATADGGGMAEAQQLVSSTAIAQASRIDPTEGSDIDSVSTRRLQILLEIGTVAVLLALQAGSAVYTLVVERSARQRLLDPRRVPLPPQAIDVGEQSARLLGRDRLRTVRRTAIVIATEVACGMVLHLTLWPTLGIVFATLLLLDRLERPLVSTPALVPSARGWTRVPMAVSVAAAVGLVVLGGLAIWSVVVALVLGPFNTSDAGLYESYIRVALLFGGFLLLLAPLPLVLGRRLVMLSLSRQIRADVRPPTIVFRSFADDSLRIRSRTVGARFLDRLTLRRWERFEEVVARSLGAVGPVRALSEPGTRLPPLGAVRESASMDVWRDRITELMDAAPMIAVCVARTESLRWEVWQISERNAIARTMFLLPPTDPMDRRRRLHALAAMLNLHPGMIDLEAPGSRVLAVTMPLPGRPVVYTSRAHDDVSYVVAIELAAQQLRQVDVPPPPAVVPGAPLVWNGPLFYQPGAAPRLRRWYSRPWMVAGAIWVLAAVVGAAFSPALDSNEISSYEVIDTSFKVVALARDAGTDAVLGVLANGQAIDARTGRVLVDDGFDLEVSELAAADGWLVALSAAEGRIAAAEVGADDSWTRSVDAVPRGLAIAGGRVFVSLADRDQLLVLDLASGEEIRRMALESVPWGVAVIEDGVFVGLAGSDRVVELDPISGDTRRQLRVPAGPRRLLVNNDLLEVVSVRLGTISVIDTRTGTTRSVLDGRLDPTISSSAGSAALVVDDGESARSLVTLDDPVTVRTCTRRVQPDATVRTMVVDANGELYAAFYEFNDLVRISRCET